MQMIKVNGEEMEFRETTILDFLKKNGYKPDRVVVEKNLEIIPKSEWGKVLISDGDSVEILMFMGGG